MERGEHRDPVLDHRRDRGGGRPRHVLRRLPPGHRVTRHVLVAGTGVAGAAAARVLLDRGDAVTVVDRSASSRSDALAAAGARILIAVGGPPAVVRATVDEVVVSPG